MKRSLYVLGALVVIVLAAIIISKSLPKESQKLTVLHPFSFSNIAVFHAALEEPEFWNRRAIAETSRHIDILMAEGDNSPIIAVTPFTNALIAASKNKDIRVIGGAGQNGLYLISNGGKTLNELEEKKIGTARADSLEIFLVEAMKERRYEKIYFDDPFVAITGMENKQLDAVTHVEPFVTTLEEKGMHIVLTSKRFWGDHPDAVIVTTRQVLQKHSDIIKKGMEKIQKAELFVKSNPEAAAAGVAALYDPITTQQLVKILPNQLPKVDIRNDMEFLRRRFVTMKDMGLINSNVAFPEGAFDFSLID